jgi:hypothetical protein
MENDYYLKVGKASDLSDKKDRILFRIFEMVPGILTWLTFILAVLFSYFAPEWVAVFVIIFVIYWLFRTVYLSFHLKGGYKKMIKNEKVDWLEKLNYLKVENPELKAANWKDIYHLIVIPMYKEPLAILREVFQSLMKSDYPKNRMIVILACEERAREDARETAETIKKEYGDRFFRFLVTWHPNNIPGEIAGKGSNETWASRRAKEEIIDPLGIPYENIIDSSLDADTCVFEKYFSCLTYHYLTAKKPIHSSYQPVSLFTNNIWQAPALSRVFSFSSSFWQMMCQERPERLISFSSHSMSFKQLVDIDFKQTNVVSDDSRVFWQCFFKFNGDHRVIPLYYPISMDANVAQSLPITLKNVYLQERRWAYGAGEIPYYLFGCVKNKKISLGKKLSNGLFLIENHWSWATNAIIVFFLGWLPLILGHREFSQTLLSYNLPVLTGRLLTIAMIGSVSSAYFSILLLPPKPINFGRNKYLFLVLEWFLIPLIMIFFTAVPAIEAQTRWMLGKYLGFWPTPKMRQNSPK